MVACKGKAAEAAAVEATKQDAVVAVTRAVRATKEEATMVAVTECRPTSRVAKCPTVVGSPSRATPTVTSNGSAEQVEVQVLVHKGEDPDVVAEGESDDEFFPG